MGTWRHSGWVQGCIVVCFRFGWWDVSDRFKAYADLYEANYGVRETVDALIPYMIEAFLNADPAAAAWPKLVRARLFEQNDAVGAILLWQRSW